MSTTRRHPALRDIGPFTDTRRAGLVQATPAEAAALLAACSLPSTVLTAQDLVPIARQLASVRTGMRAEDLRYQQEASARDEYIRQIETAAVMRVRADLRKAGWSTISRENAPGWGADLSAWRRQGPAVITRAVEVKGKGGASLASVVLQRSQYERARRSAAARDQEWWLVQCAKVLDPQPPLPVERSAEWVAREWSNHQNLWMGLGEVT